MRAPTVGQERAGAVQKIVGCTAISTESAPAVQALHAPTPLRPRDTVLFNAVTPANLDRQADFALAVGRVALAERLAHRAADMRDVP